MGLISVQAIRQNAPRATNGGTRVTNVLEVLEEAVRERTHELSGRQRCSEGRGGRAAGGRAQLRQVQKMEAVGQLTRRHCARASTTCLPSSLGGIDLARRRLNGPARVVNHLTQRHGEVRPAPPPSPVVCCPFARSRPLLPERLDSRDLVSGMCELLDRTLGERCNVEVDAASRTLWPVYVDRTSWKMRSSNLAVNARDAMAGGRRDAQLASCRLRPHRGRRYPRGRVCCALMSPIPVAA